MCQSNVSRCQYTPGRTGCWPSVCSLECGAGDSEHGRGEWASPSLNLDSLVCKRRSMIFVAVCPNTQSSSVSVVPRGSTGTCAAALHRFEGSFGRLDLVWQLRIETFRDRRRVAAGLAVPRNPCLGREHGVITQSHSLAVSHSLDTSDAILELHVLVSAPAGRSPRWLWSLMELPAATC